MLNRKLFWILALGMLITSCGDDDPVIPNEEELITTVSLSFFDPVTMDPINNISATFRDLDGDGGDAPVIDDLTLDANTRYLMALEFTNELEEPAEDITEEVIEEGDEHQVFFSVSGADLDVDYADADVLGQPLGVQSFFNSGQASSGQLTIVLRHMPDKTAAGVADGDIANAGGETDIEVTFNVAIQ
jgi:hypothetical protein